MQRLGQSWMLKLGSARRMGIDMRRRAVLSGLLAGITLRPSWADAGAPQFLSAANDAQNQSWLIGVSQDGQHVFRRAIPSRGHAAAAHPHHAVVVAFARRPGRFAVLMDCATGSEVGRLNAPEGRHFYGHGAFTADGRYLLTTENAFEQGDGRIGIWDAGDGYKRVGETPSGGVGPHEIIRLPKGGFAVANGGIQTHPDYGRAKLNLPDMRPNLAYLSDRGALQDLWEPPDELHQNSIRHIDADATGRVAIALQWQGNPLASVPLAALHEPGKAIRLLDHPETMRLKQYAGSIAISADGRQIVVTGPKGGHLIRFDGVSAAPQSGAQLELASGVVATEQGFVVTWRGGLARLVGNDIDLIPCAAALIWDNHVVAL